MTDAPKKPAQKKAAPKAGRRDARQSQSDDAAATRRCWKPPCPHAAFDGFTDSVLAKAGTEAGVDKAELARLFANGPIAWSNIYSTCDRCEMEKRLAAMDLKAMKIRERIATAVKTRLWILKPHKEAARRAAAAAVAAHACGAGRQADLSHRGCDVAGGRRHLDRFQFLHQARDPGRRLWLDADALVQRHQRG